MEHRHDGSRAVLRIDRGEEVLSTIAGFCKDHGIGCGSLTGIGAVRDAELGFYHLPTFTYETQTISDICELISLVGNVALVDGEPFVHAHATLGKRDLSVVGGHLVSAVVAVTVEVYLDGWELDVHRQLDSEVKLKLLEL